MCCLFGLIDYRHSLTARQKNRILAILSTACEARGTDATGIAYHSRGRLRIYKRPVPAHWLRFHVPEDAYAILGHTRMTTQGSAKRNYNNHPFYGATQEGVFALAHNGVLYNDRELRHNLHLPTAKIETDSFVAVQLIERQRTLDFGSLKYMAEQVEGSFTFTALDAADALYIIKGDNPICLYHYPQLGLFLYASTEEILKQALQKLFFAEKPEKVPVECGEIVRIDPTGRITRGAFDDSSLFCRYYETMWKLPYSGGTQKKRVTSVPSYLEELKSVAMSFGYAPEDIDRLTAQGFTPEELEEFLYCGEL